ncbi:MAG TPA: bifunctional phosphopantothenoylcysteine decarboxylase/phosphopantothenate--cysteine ligase CoaBC [Balneolaceae bacterium]|nr:bifunctional phosphopantothenoylcysteine decarboxylase/phosphopantothenate--cysteine ligase CoaBC [Balneolaceae bacterium]
MLPGKRIILGVTGGIAAYKAVSLLRLLQKEGAEVRVTMTPAASRFVGVETFAALSKHEVAVRIFPEKDSPDAWTRHISWGEWADLFIIAPCTSNTLAKIAHGLSDNMLTSTVLAARCPLLICPTMDGKMYQAPATQNNLEQIRSFNYQVLEPEEGYLASGLEGKGRLPEIEVILQKAREILSAEVTGPLNGKKVLVTAGPTREHLDPVRFISNPSTGKMGFAMAEAARNMGADVTLIHGPVQLDQPPDVEAIEIESTEELFEQVRGLADADVIIMTAAVSDFTPKQYHSQKIKKETSRSTIELRKTPDILGWLGEHKRQGQTLIGFAMETENLVENARRKWQEKNLDWIAANTLNDKNAGFASDSNTVHLIGKDSEKQISGTKKEVAAKILGVIFGS